jgi:hypothetical protein
MPTASRQDIVTFKADRSLLDALVGIPNRSEFIRSAVLAALQNSCPLCKGSGTLSPNQKEHWLAFAESHGFSECGDCHERHLICSAAPGSSTHPPRRAKPGRG